MANSDSIGGTLAAVPERSWLMRLFMDELGFFIIYVLALIGVAYTVYDAGKSAWYWESLVPVYCLFCIAIQWPQVGVTLKDRAKMAFQQMLHWGAFLLAMQIIFMPQVKILLNDQSTSFVLIMMLILSTFLAGIYLNWRLCVVAVLMALSEIVLIYFQESAIYVLLLGVAAAVIYGLWVWWRARARVAA
jgi:hypothetical protein